MLRKKKYICIILGTMILGISSGITVGNMIFDLTQGEEKDSNEISIESTISPLSETKTQKPLITKNQTKKEDLKQEKEREGETEIPEQKPIEINDGLIDVNTDIVKNEILDSMEEDIKPIIYSEEKEGYVTANSLNIREKSSTDSSIVGSLINKDKVSLLGEEGPFYKIKYQEGYAYVSKTYISDVAPIVDEDLLIEEEPIGISRIGLVIVDNLNLREESNLTSNILGTLNKDEEINVLSEEGVFYKIESKTKKGYAYKSYIKVVDENEEDETETPKEDNTVDNSVNSPIEDTSVPKDEEVTVPKEEEVTDTPKEDFVYEIKYGRVNVNKLNIRESSNTNCEILGLLEFNNKVTVIGEENNFYKIKQQDYEGYVHMEYITLGEDEIIVEEPIVPETTPSTPTTPEPPKETTPSTPDTPNYDYKSIETSVGMSFDEYLNKLGYQYNGKTGKEATKEEISSVANPKDILSDKVLKWQLLRIDEFREVDVSVLDSYLSNMGSLSGKGQEFIDAARKYNIDPVYLISHAIWETGRGSSRLANGVVVTKFDGKEIDAVTVYNLFGIGAYDYDAIGAGASAAYQYDWTSIDNAIDGGASWISKNYINSSENNQNTVWRMKWNVNTTWHQYATDIHWCKGISYFMDEMSSSYKSILTFDTTIFRN